MEALTSESLRKGYQRAVIIGCSMIAGLFTYIGVAEFVAGNNTTFNGYSPLPEDVYGKLMLALLALAIFDFALIPFIRNRMLSVGGRSHETPYSPYSTPPPSVQSLVSASIVSFALCESIAIYGLVLFLLNGSRRDFYLFVVIALAAFALYFPRYERWKEWTGNRLSG
jgi:hypothetical protein